MNNNKLTTPPTGEEALAPNKKTPLGYKQTEVGVIPEDWVVDKVGTSFEVHNHLRLPISKIVRKRMVGVFPYYGPTSIQGFINEYRVNGTYALIGEDGDHFLKWKTTSMTLLVSGKFNVNNHAHLVMGTKNLTEWFFWFFSNRDLAVFLTRQGAGRYKLNKTTLLQIPCAIPPLKEQKAIAKALSDVGALIEAQEKLIAKKQAIKTATMQQLLTGKKRLLGFGEGKGTKQTELGEIPEDWEVCTLDDITSFISSGKTDADDKGNYPLFGSTGVIGCSNADYSGEAILVARVGANAGNLRKVTGKYGVTDNTIIVRVKEDNVINFYQYFLVQRNLNLLVFGSGQPLITGSQLKSLSVVHPIKSEQKAISNVLFDMDKEIEALESKLKKTKSIKQGMMQELLTGKTRLIKS